MTSNVAVYMYVGSCVMYVIQTSAMSFVFNVRELFFYEECTRKSCFSVALNPSIAVALPSYHVGKTLSSLVFFLQIFSS